VDLSKSEGQETDSGVKNVLRSRRVKSLTQIDNKFLEALKHENVQDIVDQVQESQQLDFIVQPIKDEIFSS